MNLRRIPSWKTAAAAAALLSAAALGAPAADSPAAHRAHAELARVRAQIAAIAKRRDADLQRRDALGAALRRADLAIAAKRRTLESLRTAAAAARKRLDALRAEQARDLAALKQERRALAGQTVAAYMIGRREQIELLLNQSAVGEVGRMLAYYGYFGRARAAQIAAIRGRMQSLAAVARATGQQAMHLHDLQDDAVKALAALGAARAQRAAALQAAAARVQSAEQRLADLRRQQHSVESLIDQLARVIPSFPTRPAKNFVAMRGRLPWPVAGRVVDRFGDVRMDAAQGRLRWHGLLIRTAPGARVRAPYFGRVVYADWLQGLGLLLILSHGDGYLSLYAHAEVLYKSVGDWVAPGDVIAAMSSAPGPSPPELYFEIRHGRTPLDPQAWLAGRR